MDRYQFVTQDVKTGHTWSQGFVFLRFPVGLQQKTDFQMSDVQFDIRILENFPSVSYSDQ